MSCQGFVHVAQMSFFEGLPADQFEQILQQRDAQLANLLEDDAVWWSVLDILFDLER